MQFETFEAAEFYAMISFAVREGLTFEASTDISDGISHRVYKIRFTGGF
jgi:hypothetical protein